MIPVSLEKWVIWDAVAHGGEGNTMLRDHNVKVKGSPGAKGEEQEEKKSKRKKKG